MPHAGKTKVHAAAGLGITLEGGARVVAREGQCGSRCQCLGRDTGAQVVRRAVAAACTSAHFHRIRSLGPTEGLREDGQVVSASGQGVEEDGLVAIATIGGVEGGGVDQNIAGTVGRQPVPSAAESWADPAVAHHHIGAIRRGEGMPHTGQTQVHASAGQGITGKGGAGIVTGEGQGGAVRKCLGRYADAQVVDGDASAGSDDRWGGGLGDAAQQDEGGSQEKGSTC